VAQKLKRAATPQTSTKRAVIYCRVSTAAQAEDDKISLGEQLADCETYCKERGYEVVATYQDIMSGATSKRPDFQRMISAAGEGAFDVVVTWKVDRIGRGLFPMARLLEALEPNGIHIEAVKEQVDQRYLGLFASVGKIELDNIRERTMNMRRAYARQGKVKNGAVRYGYRLNDATEPVIDPEESKILLEAATRYAAGELLADVVRDFRARGVPTRAGHTIRHGLPWPEPYLSRLVGDEAYFTGKRTFGGETVQYPPIYSAELWSEISARRRQNKQWNKRNTKDEWLLQNLLVCRCCEMRFICRAQLYYYIRRADGSVERRNYSQPRRFYRCQGMTKYPETYKCRPSGQLTAKDVEAAVWAALTEALDQPENLVAGIRQRIAELENQEEEPEIGDADRQLSLLKVERVEYVRQRARGRIDDATLDKLLAENDAQTTYWQERADSYAKLRSGVEAQRRMLESATSYLEGLREQISRRLDELTFTERRDLLTTLVDRIWVEQDESMTMEGVLSGAVDSDQERVNSLTALSRAIM
jgi:DNA invertase Pin-like site-specific DNA recombinase